MVLVVILYTLFAATFTLGKGALTYLSPILFTAVRMIFAGTLLLLYCKQQRKIRHVIKRDWWLFIRIMVFHIFFAYVLEFWALEYVTSSKACLLYSLSPFVTAVLSYFLLSERFTIKQIIGLIIGFVGFIPILMTQTPSEEVAVHLGFFSTYEIALIFSVVSSAYGWMMVKKAINKGYSFVMINGIGMMGGGILAFILSLIVDGIPVLKQGDITIPYIAHIYGIFVENICVVTMYMISIITIANIIGYNLYAHLLLRYSPTFLSFAGFMTPLITAFFGWIFLDEKITWHFFVTMMCIVYGLYLFHEKKEIQFQEQGL